MNKREVIMAIIQELKRILGEPARAVLPVESFLGSSRPRLVYVAGEEDHVIFVNNAEMWGYEFIFDEGRPIAYTGDESFFTAIPWQALEGFRYITLANLEALPASNIGTGLE